jgi:hypothetical protein
MLQELNQSNIESLSGGSRHRSSGLERLGMGVPTGMAMPTVNISQSVSPAIIVAPFLRNSEYSFNLIGNSNSFNTSNLSSSLIILS